jgi:uncharacterized iron-regulated membrane protein
MRKWHRWLTVFFGIFLFWIAVTGVLSHIAALWPSSSAQMPAQAALAADFQCPPEMMCRPRPPANGGAAWVGFFHHLHSGETFGPVGTAISILSGLTMIFLSFSGLWMYIQMWRSRRERSVKPGWFWQ